MLRRTAPLTPAKNRRRGSKGGDFWPEKEQRRRLFDGGVGDEDVWKRWKGMMPAVKDGGGPDRGGVGWTGLAAAVDGGLRRLEGGPVWTHFICYYWF